MPQRSAGRTHCSSLLDDFGTSDTEVSSGLPVRGMAGVANAVVIFDGKRWKGPRVFFSMCTASGEYYIYCAGVDVGRREV